MHVLLDISHLTLINVKYHLNKQNHTCHCMHFMFPGIDEDESSADAEMSAGTEDMPPLEGEDDDASRMEEVD